MSRAGWSAWAARLQARVAEGLSGPGLCQAIQAQLPGQAPAVAPVSPTATAAPRRQRRAQALRGVQA